ncbi:hypothetical protein RIF29_14707 [Crotalaria pallida]|uniref:TF-B3 domain-containing protein n=1 Tax=Crotalaria pallida TaxID=3830 RepID=A0AAN9FDV7_CROPI
MSNPVFLKPPDGTEWKVYWMKHDDEIQFQKGWKEFAKYYSLDHGHMVMFKYEATFHFYVNIFDTSATEIGYPFNVTKDEKDNLDQISDDSVESLDGLASGQKTTLKSPMSFPKRLKITKKGRTRDIETSSNLKNLQHCVQPKASQSEGTNFEMIVVASAKQELNDDMGGDILSTECPKVDQLTSTKTSVAMIPVTTFRSKNPSFTRIMKPSHVNGYSLAFDKTPCPVVYNVPSITAGWNKFASENNLNVGDACIFELARRKQILYFNVFIFRGVEELSCSLPKGIDASPTPLLISPCLGIIRPLKEAEKFNSENPVFMIKLTICMERNGPAVPCSFARKYFDKRKQTVIMQFGKRLWPVNFRHYPNERSGKLFSGWSLFVEESKLQAGDVCIFELINREFLVFGVHVFRG